MSTPNRAPAPAKLNLALVVGPVRGDGKHEVVTVMAPLELADDIDLDSAEALSVEGYAGDTLVRGALLALASAAGTDGRWRVTIEKRIPVAAGLGGGSADAGAVLRLAADEVDGLPELAAELGADVPSQLDPALALVGGAGEVVEPLSPPRHFGVVLIAADDGLSTAEVYVEADRLGLGRDPEELDSIAGELREAAGQGASPLEYHELLVNDLAHAALSLRPAIGGALTALKDAGAEVALVTGSGPTAFGVFDDIAAADAAAGQLAPRFAGAIVAGPDPER